jgi:hypothetical protein
MPDLGFCSEKCGSLPSHWDFWTAITTAEQVEGQPVTYLFSRISVQLCTCYVSDYSDIKVIFMMDINYSQKEDSS